MLSTGWFFNTPSRWIAHNRSHHDLGHPQAPSDDHQVSNHHQAILVMTITKSNKHKLSLDQDKPNEKGGCTLATPYALMRSLILDYQISITPLVSCSPLHSKGVSQLNIWARELSWTSRRGIYTPYFKTYSLGSNLAHFGWPDAQVKVIGHVRSVTNSYMTPAQLSETGI